MSPHDKAVRDDQGALGTRLDKVGGAGEAARERTKRPSASAVTGTVFTLIVLLVFMMFSSMARAGESPTPVNLLTADSFAILAGAGITNAGETTINGDVGSHPTTSQTGFDPCPPAPLNCVTLTGTNHMGDLVTQGAKTDLVTAYNQAASYPRTTIPTELGPSIPDPLTPGVYDSESTTFGITGTLTLDAGGDPDGVFIFYMGSTATSLTTGVGSDVVLQGDAQACNVFWVVAGTATLLADSNFVGTIMAQQSITLGDNVTVDGRLLAQTGSVTLIHDTITRSDCASGPGATPGTTPGGTPGGTPGATPGGTPGGTPGTTPSNAPPPTSTLPGRGDAGDNPTTVLAALLALAGLLAAAGLVARRRTDSRRTPTRS